MTPETKTERSNAVSVTNKEPVASLLGKVQATHARHRSALDA